MSFIKHISGYLPEDKLHNDEISELFPTWENKKIFEKIGIRERRVAKESQFTSDIAVEVLDIFFLEHPDISKNDIDYLLLCTQSPDFFLPTTACIVQQKAGLSKKCAAIDINQGCSGYIYGLSLADGLVSSGKFKNVLLVTAETYTKYIHQEDRGNRSLFGDAATVTLISGEGKYKIKSFTLGTDGSGAENLIVKNGASRYPKTNDESDRANYLHMNGSAIFNFTAKNIPPLVEENLISNNKTIDSVDLFIFHQANTYILNFLRKKIGIPEEKFLIEMESYGNTVSSSIPLAFMKIFDNDYRTISLVGFGVGYSWGACVVERAR